MKGRSIKITIDGKEVKTTDGKTLLWAALDAGIYIPNLCAIRESRSPFSSCRLCFVKIEGIDRPVTSCGIKSTGGMVIFTNCAEVERLRRRSFELLMSEHDINCRLCGKKHDCELLRISKHFNYRLKSVELTNLKKRFPVDRSHKYIIIDPNRCVLCGRCVWVCSTIRKKGILGFINRGKYARISTFSNIPLAETECDGCMMCVEICPAGGIVKK